MIYCTTAAPARLADERDTARLRLEARTDVQRIRFSRPGSVAGVHKPSLRAPNVYRLSCTARAHVPKPERRGGCRREVACNACRTATAVTPSRWQESSRLGRRAEAGP